MRARTAERNRAHWSMGGHFGASQIPGWDAAGPGSIEPALLSVPAPHCPVVTGRRPKLTAAPATISRARRMALEAVITSDIDPVEPVPSLAQY